MQVLVVIIYEDHVVISGGDSPQHIGLFIRVRHTFIMQVVIIDRTREVPAEFSAKFPELALFITDITEVI